MRFQKYFGLFRFREKLHPCEDAISLEVCVEIWRICHADRDRKHELYAKNFSCEGDGRCSFIFDRMMLIGYIELKESLFADNA